MVRLVNIFSSVFPQTLSPHAERAGESSEHPFIFARHNRTQVKPWTSLPCLPTRQKASSHQTSPNSPCRAFLDSGAGAAFGHWMSKWGQAQNTDHRFRWMQSQKHRDVLLLCCSRDIQHLSCLLWPPQQELTGASRGTAFGIHLCWTSGQTWTSTATQWI